MHITAEPGNVTKRGPFAVVMSFSHAAVTSGWSHGNSVRSVDHAHWRENMFMVTYRHDDTVVASL